MSVGSFKTLSVPGQQDNDNGVFPLVLTPEAPVADAKDASQTVSSSRKELLAHLDRHGAVVLRGLPLKNAEDFLAILNAFEFEFDDYVGGGGPRNSVLGPVHNSTDTPPQFNIPFHHELAYLSKYPSALIFFCEVAPGAGGETPILLSNRLYKAMATALPAFVSEAEEKGVRYERVLQDDANCDRTFQRSWQTCMETGDRAEAEKRARDVGSEVVEWLDDGSMRVVSKVMPAVITDPRENLKTWFNSVILLHPAAQDSGKKKPWRVTYGDGSEMKDDDIIQAKKLMDDHRVDLPWAQGDVMLVDNKLALHARNSFTPPRSILAAIAR